MSKTDPATAEGDTLSGATLRQQDRQEEEYAFPYHYVARFSERFQHFFVDDWAINYASTMEFLLDRLRLSNPQRIVDIGCGDGRFSRELAQAFPLASVLGIDYSRRAVALAAAMNPEVRNLQFDSLDINVEVGIQRFDTAILMEVFEHIPLPDADRFMESVRRLLVPGGFLYLTVPHINKPLEYKHFQHFSIESLSRYVRPHFDIVDIVPFEKRGIRRKLMEQVLNNRLFVLNSRVLLNAIYGWYRRALFTCATEAECQRLFILARAR